MTQSLNFVLPSIHRISKKENKSVVRPHFTQQESQPLQFKLSRTHGRTTSVPSKLPSYQKQQEEHKLSFNVLLDAIDLDQQMRQFFKTEVMKSKTRTNKPFVPPSIMMARRRSKSAPGAPPSYHQERAFNSRWIAPNYNNKTATSASAAQEIAQFIVKQHIESVKKRE